MNKLAKETWEKHLQASCDRGIVISFTSGQLALHSAILTLEALKGEVVCDDQQEEAYDREIDYLKGSKYYSEDNKDSDY